MTEPSTDIRIEVASVTDRGKNEKRPLNEDSMLSDLEQRIFAVADGVGGAEAGEVASETAVEVLQQAFTHHQDGDDVEDLMEIAIQRANASIFQMSREQPRFSMMATTIVALHLDGLRATIGHVGDSRLYRLTPVGTLQRETDDHSVVEEEVRAGRMTAQQAASHPSRNVISRALGAEQAVEVDMKTIEFEEGTTFLLCSDGITRHLPDAELNTVLQSADNLDDACAEMKRICYERGAEDNLTAIVIRVGDRKASQPTTTGADFEEEHTLVSERAARANATTLPDSPIPAALLQRPFDNPDNATTDAVPAEMVNPASRNPTSQPTASIGAASTPKSSGGAGRILGVFFLLLVAAAAAFYGGMRFEKSGGLNGGDASKLPVATPSPTPESAEAHFQRKLRAVDLAPTVEASRMTAEASNLPLDSPDPEFLYLYGRAMLLTGKNQDAVAAFEKTIQRINENMTARNGQLKIDARLAHIAASLRSDDINKAREAARALGEEVIRTEIETAPANTSPSPTVSP